MLKLAAALTAFALLATSQPADARGGKPGGAFCHVSKSCQSESCVRQNPSDKFGVCCTAQTCAELNAQCGSVDNGCGVPISCGDCDPGSNCIVNQCMAGPTTTTSTTTTSSTTSTTNTSTTSSTTTTTSTTTTSTTIPGATTTTLAGPTTTTTLGCVNQPNSCGGFDECAPEGACLIFEHAGDGCGFCMVFDFPCEGTPCTSDANCGVNEACIVNSCCGAEGVCAQRCNPLE